MYLHVQASRPVQFQALWLHQVALALFILACSPCGLVMFKSPDSPLVARIVTRETPSLPQSGYLLRTPPPQVLQAQDLKSLLSLCCALVSCRRSQDRDRIRKVTRRRARGRKIQFRVNAVKREILLREGLREFARGSLLTMTSPPVTCRNWASMAFQYQKTPAIEVGPFTCKPGVRWKHGTCTEFWKS